MPVIDNYILNVEKKMKQIEITTLIKECTPGELSSDDLRLVEEAKDATRRSYAPFSGYHVGAAILLDNGKIVSGSNQENAAYPSGLCAERTAAFYASSAYPGVAFKKLAIAAWTDSDNREGGFQSLPVSPCGGCRQALLEYEHLYGPIEVILYGKDKIYIVPSILSLLPMGFTEF